jgi:predicted dinucleotide-binding enzyme
MKLGVIGAGKVGGTLGAAFVRAGHEVTVGARDVAKVPGAVSIAQAVEASDVVLLATPFQALEEVLRATGPMTGKVVIDASNPLQPGLVLAVGHSDSGAEVLQRFIPRARVVKCFNTVGFEVMERPLVGGRRASMFLAGDDAAARGTTSELAASIGFDPIDVGVLARSRLLEPAAVLWISLAMVQKQGRRIALRLEGEGARAATISRSPTPRRVAVIGAGHIGGGLALAWARAGNTVTLGVRTPSDPALAPLVTEGVKVGSPAEAVASADVVAVAIPAQAVESLAGLPFSGKLVIDCTNHVAPGFSLSFGHTTSWAEQVATKLAGARIFKSFNAQGAENLASPVYSTGPAANFFCGDDEGGREVVRQLVADVGFEPVFAGGLTSARLLEPLMMLWVNAARAKGRRAMGFQLLRD